MASQHRTTPVGIQRNIKVGAWSVITATALLIAGGALMIHHERAAAQEMDHHHHQAASPFADIDRAVAVIHPTAGNEARGVVMFRQEGEQVHVHANIQGLEPNSHHGFHVHEFGDCTAADATSAGGHYNPEGHPHGLPNGEDRHAGDFGNLEADDDGVAVFELTVDNLTIAGDHNPVLGRAVIVHESEDDGSQPLGDAGPRIGCGVIGVAQAGE